ncbi:MAG: hypothetical protein G8345_17915, partial [Magnetococcales bacterium]|nr:hypothetical protein [Magnetococcales bacterium]
GLAVGAGLLVLGSAVGANRRRRGRESAICRLLGATRGEMALAMGWEFFLLGLLASVAAMVVAQGITAVVIGVGMDDVWQGYWVESVLLVGAGGVGVALLGMWGAWREAGWPIRRVLAMREL